MPLPSWQDMQRHQKMLAVVSILCASAASARSAAAEQQHACPLLQVGSEWPGHGRVLFKLTHSAASAAPCLEEARRFEAAALEAGGAEAAQLARCTASSSVALGLNASSLGLGGGHQSGVLLHPFDTCLAHLAPSLAVAPPDAADMHPGLQRRLLGVYVIPSKNLTCCCDGGANATSSCCCAADPAACCPVAAAQGCPGRCTWVYVLVLGTAALLCLILMVLMHRYRAYMRRVRLSSEAAHDAERRSSFEMARTMGLRTFTPIPESNHVIRAKVMPYIRSGFSGDDDEDERLAAAAAVDDSSTAPHSAAAATAASDSKNGGPGSSSGSSSSNGGGAVTKAAAATAAESAGAQGAGAGAAPTPGGTAARAELAGEKQAPQQADCPVCLDEVCEGDLWARFRCNHGVCRSCLYQLLQSVTAAKDVRCPTCRMLLVPSLADSLLEDAKRRSMELARDVEDELAAAHAAEAGVPAAAASAPAAAGAGSSSSGSGGAAGAGSSSGSSSSSGGSQSGRTGRNAGASAPGNKDADGGAPAAAERVASASREGSAPKATASAAAATEVAAGSSSGGSSSSGGGGSAVRRVETASDAGHVMVAAGAAGQQQTPCASGAAAAAAAAGEARAVAEAGQGAAPVSEPAEADPSPDKA